jgi:hypothetical protein
MPHWTECYTKQELSEMTARLTTDQIKLDVGEIATFISQTQRLGHLTGSVTLNRVVSDTVVNVFKNDLQYSVVEDDTGQTPGTTLLISVSW